MRLFPFVSSLSLMLLLSFAGGCSGRRGGEDVDSQLSFGSRMAQRGLWSEAYFRFEQATRTSPTDPKAWNNLAVACEALGDFEEALSNYRRGLELNPQSRTLRANYDRFSGFYSAFKAAKERDRQRREGISEDSDDEADEGDSGTDDLEEEDANTEGDS